MKNVIMLVLDSFSYYEYVSVAESTPFLHTLENKTLFASNVYSQGPHSEVGVRGLICGCNTLDHGGSSRFFAGVENTVFDIFLEENYDVSYIGHPALYVSKKLRNNSNFHHYYTVIYNFLYLWRERLEYWAQIYTKRKLDKREKDIVIGLCQDTFDVMSDFWSDVSSKKENICFLAKSIENVDTKNIIETVYNEEKKFKENAWEYAKSLLSDFDNNILVNLTNIDEAKVVDSDFINLIKSKNRSLLKKLKRKQMLDNLLPDQYTIRDLIYALKDKFTGKEKKNIEIISELQRRFQLTEEFELNLQKRGYYPPSIKRQLDFVLELLKKEETGKPHFIYLQPEELHYHHNWFSYDIVNEENIDKEFLEIGKFVRKKAGRAGGYLTQTLALNYVDQCIKEFFKNLRKDNLLRNTVILITADHGSSFGHAPIRNALPYNNFFSENYHIPLFIYDQGKKQKIEKYLLNYDIVPLLLKTLNIDSKKYYEKEKLSVEGRKIVHSEYMGPGYQDLLGKEIWFSARNENYKINYIVRLFGAFKEGHLEGVYDIQNDPQERNNLVNRSYDHKEVEELLQYLEIRRAEIQMQQDIDEIFV